MTTVVRLLLVLLSLHIAFAASPFKNVIILMMENHSFDNIFGFTPGIGNLTGKEYNREKPSSWLSKKYYAGRGSKYCTIPDPGHSFTATGRQLYLPDKAPAVGVGKPTNGGFVADFTGAGKKGHDLQEVMNIYLPEQLPIITTLAREFVVCRNWYASLPGPTGPNRMFAHTATTNGYNGGNYYNYPLNATAIQEHLMAENYTWMIHFHDFTTAHGIHPLNTHQDNYLMDMGFKHFLTNLKKGTIPNYTWLVPLLGEKDGMRPTSQHPSYDIRPGESQIKEIYETLRASDRWNDTLFVITYDEHGGFWDSVAPPATVNPSPEYAANPDPFDFGRLGVRVPGVLVSPWLPKGQLDDVLYDHTSIPASLRKIFNLKSKPLSNREAIAHTFPSKVLPKPRYDTPAVLPKVPVDPDFCLPKAGEEKVNDLFTSMNIMYYDLLGKRGLLEGRNVMHPSKLRTDPEAGDWAREAICLLFPRSCKLYRK